MGTVLEVEDAGANGRPRGNAPVLPAPAATFRQPDAAAAYLPELDTYYDEVKGFRNREPDEVLLMCSGILARLTEIRALCQRTNDRNLQALRTKEIDPLIAALEIQFKIHSRLQSVREMDLRLSGGQV